ncbi:GLPGLI family protein [Chryseobacterium profundimaris]|uniref:GLPGLI family protein n=1 Tax=Chryseobacterium profundimaris TaxID=1387275 RepID=A0ABY1PAT1_9FLAO|nr:GLPGLI family protein [Chryseobacterium profundimaris]SMP30341.1 GLPGLI family protein [Chryseobacterium profundimaris]
MRKITIFIAFILFALSYSQTNRFYYEVKLRNSNADDYRTSGMVLDVNPESIKFYDEDFIEVDSLNKAAEEKKVGYGSRASTKTDQLIVRKPNSFKNTWYRDFFDYFAVQTNDDMSWKILPETTTYQGYNLQKAITEFGGRSWTAWFCKEIPINEGPYKFRGLPGLIFLLSDSNEDIIYKLVKNKKLNYNYNTDNFLENHYDKKPIKISLKKYNAYLVDIYENPTRMFRDQVNNGSAVSFKDKEVKSPEELNQMKKNMQRMIKSRYIPVELNTKPDFQ